MMNIQIWYIDEDGYLVKDCDGEFMKDDDHLAAMKEQHERDMRFADYYSSYCWEFARENSCPDMDMKQAYEYWKTNIDK